MPRPKKQPTVVAPSPPLKNCHVAFVRLTSAGIDGISQADLQSKISGCGGTIVTKIDQCTHFILTNEQYQKPSKRVQEAMANSDVKLVTSGWLKESFNATNKVDEAKYMLGASDDDDKKDTSDQDDSTKTKATGKKRGRAKQDDNGDDDDVKSTASKKPKAEPEKPAEKKKASVINVPLDDGLSLNLGYKVVVDDDGTIYDVTLNQTNAGHNNNKFYRIQLLVDGTGKNWCWTRWGRVGERGQTKMLGDGSYDVAFKEFGKKFKDKNGNSWEKRLDPIKSGKYSFIERSYEDSDNEDDDQSSKDKKSNGTKGVKKEEDEEDETIESELAEPVQRLMKLIFNQDYFSSTLASLDYDANKMPLGKLSKNTLIRGYTVLKNLTGAMGTSARRDIEEMSNQYFSLIPHAFGRNRPPVLDNMQMIKKEIELLESLTDMQLANDIMKNAKGNKTTDKVHLLDRQFEGLSMREMTPLEQKSSEFQELEQYLVASAGHTHRMTYEVEDIFRIERQGEFDRFDNSKFSKVSNTNRRLLWHGSRCTNFGGILSQGLRIAPPEAPVSGYMFGKGIYLADMSTKSANYCNAHNSGNIGLLLLCEAELGDPPLKLTNASSTAGSDAAAQGAISTWGVGLNAPQLWKDASCVNQDLKGISMPDVTTKPPASTNEAGAWLQYNEYICYDIAQVKLRYLFRVKIGYKGW